MRARAAELTTSAADRAGFPAPSVPEIAFAGRSNVGKSSIINALTGKTGLARTSNAPGRTRLINWFMVSPPAALGMPPVHFVDLPGYGYAKVSRSMREGWKPLIEAYLVSGRPLLGVVILVDARRGAEDEEGELCEFFQAHGIAAVVVATKIDKLAKAQRKLAAAAIARTLKLSRPVLAVSARSGDGLDDLWRRLRALAKK
ncbi:MAG TPA: ribosome biogenesis GTP-binding protein YihA/YsxC [Kofleriaceae bacterium]|nr:ribosome biogenesis GTP-binding protein YihA/YsxC [Kofleriaceae bacterium]